MNRLAYVVAFAAASLVIALSWWWLGQPIPTGSAATAGGERIPCISYAPFRRGQTPFDPDVRITAEQIDADLARLSEVTDCVRTYSVGLGLDQVPAIARRHGMKVILGLWLSGIPEKSAEEIEGAVRLANEYPDTVRMVVVGNEVLLRGEIPPGELRAIIAGVKARVPEPVTYAEVWEFWRRNPSLADVVDLITIHVLPYWEDNPLPAEAAGDHLQNIYREMAAAFPGKKLLVGEVGWPSKGRQREQSRAEPAAQARVIHDVLQVARRNGFDINVIEAFDQPWKRELEGTVGGHWGIFDVDSREPKFLLGAPVSNHPGWIWLALAGVGMAAAVVGAAYWASAGEISRRRLAAVALLAVVSGICLGLAIEQANFGEQDRYGPVVAALALVLAFVGPVVFAAAVASDDDRVSFAATLSDGDERRAYPFAAAAALVAMVAAVTATSVALGLVFDPRYREFLASGLAGTALGMLLLRLFATTARPAAVASERWFAAVLGLSAVFIVLDEGFANGQALFFCAVLLVLTAGLSGGRDARSSGSAARPQYPIG